MLNAACGDGLRSCETSRVVEGCDRAERRMSRRAADARPWFAARGRVAPQAPRAAQPTAPGAVRRVATCNALLYALLLRRRCRWMRSPRRAALLHALFAPPCVAGRGVCVSIGRRARCRGATICLFTCTKTVEGVRRFTKRRYNAGVRQLKAQYERIRLSSPSNSLVRYYCGTRESGASGQPKEAKRYCRYSFR